MRGAWLLGGFWLLGCGGTSFDAVVPDATTDGPTTEGGGGGDGQGGGDGAGGGDDASRADGADGAGGGDGAAGDDGAISDSGVSDVLTSDGACACVPYWCGCGTCNPGLIACTVDPPTCALGCPSACLELSEVTCTCAGGRCIRGGIDASTIGCLNDEDCPQGDCCAHEHGGPFCATAPNPCCGAARCP